MSYYVPWDMSYLLFAWNWLKSLLNPVIVASIIGLCTIFGISLIIILVRRFLMR